MNPPKNIVHAPIVPPDIWKLNADKFNEWREQYDYPRIINFFKNKLEDFEDWITEQNLTEEILIKNGPSLFLRKGLIIYKYGVYNNYNNEFEIVYSVSKNKIGETIFNGKIIQSTGVIQSYPDWIKNRSGNEVIDIRVDMRQGNSAFILSELELCNIGGCLVENLHNIGLRHLDFININNIVFNYCINSWETRIWFCSALNVTIKGDFSFINAYNTDFYEMFYPKFNSLKLLDGYFQSWYFEGCKLGFFVSNSILKFWHFKGLDFDGTLSNTDIIESIFTNKEIKYKFEYILVSNLYAHIKRLYSQIGKIQEAAQYFYLEKIYEKKAYLYYKDSYYMEYYSEKGVVSKIINRTRYYFKYIKSVFLDFLWGYGEKPFKLFRISILSIILFGIIYWKVPGTISQLGDNLMEAIYFSLVTFTTLGYGQNNESELLKLITGIQSMIGITFWGLLISSYTSKVRNY